MATPLVSIDLVVQNARGEILLGRRLNRPARDSWFVPGGRVLKNERLDAAFMRLTLEELGVRFGRERARLLGVFEHFYDDTVFGPAAVAGGTHYIVICYGLVLDDGGLPSILPKEQHSSYRWWNIQEAQADPQVHRHTATYLELL